VSAWDENAGRVARSFSDWYLVDCDQRVFARKGLEFAKEVYDRFWDELAHQPGDPDGPELPDLFHDAIDGLWPHDFEWMHLTGVVKDAVTNFEVYLERAADEILHFQGQQFGDRDKSASWDRLVAFYRLLGVEIASNAVIEMRQLRHILTHRRGELRTEEQRRLFANSREPFTQSVAHLDIDVVMARMDVLGSAVRTIDPIAYDHTWGGTESRAVRALTEDPLIPQKRRANVEPRRLT
jgi:hypothetical protein